MTPAVLRAITSAPSAPSALVEAAGAHALRADPGPGDSNGLDLAIALVAHPALSSDAATSLIARITARSSSAGRLAAGAYLGRSDHTPDEVHELLRNERRLTCLRYAAAHTKRTDVTDILSSHSDGEVALAVARNRHATATGRLRAALRVDAIETAGGSISGACAMVDELPRPILDAFAASATTRRLLVQVTHHPDADVLEPPTLHRVAHIGLHGPLLAARSGQGLSSWQLVELTSRLAEHATPTLLSAMRRWWGDRQLSAPERARLHLALRGAPTRWRSWSWDAAAALVALDDAHAPALVSACGRTLRTTEQWSALLELAGTFTGTVEQLVTTAAALAQQPAS